MISWLKKVDTKALRLRIEHVNSVTCNGLKTNTIFFLECPKYDDLPREYLPRYYVNYPYRCKYLNLISTENDIELQILLIFVYKSFNLRKSCSAKLSRTTEQR